MVWDREKRGIFQRKQEKPQIKKHKPLKSEGNNGDITIRQLSDGVFLFFKALGKWYKTLNTSSQVIPEPDAPSSFSLGAPSQPIQSMVISENSLHIGNTKSEQGKISLSSDKTDLVFKNKAGTERKVVGKKASSTAGDTNAEHTITLGDETGSSTFGQLYLGAGSSYLGGVISGSANVTFLTQTAYLGARFMASHGVAGGAKGLSVVGTASADEASLYLAVHNVGVGGHIGLRETANDPTAVIEVYKLYADLYINELIYSKGLTNQDIAQKLRDLNITRQTEIIADSAEPKSIEELHRQNFNIKGAKKGKDSINMGIDVLRRFKINITKNSTNAINEFKYYKWLTDKNGHVINKPDTNQQDHLIDAVRYVALNKLMTNHSGKYYIL